mmetsp:Transcript_62091/g.200188  ORF Transcript_62091/g.200188 Transcript_62091/m.200188 type:complete len:200 (-) Transcript_62091:58-657(-)
MPTVVAATAQAPRSARAHATLPLLPASSRSAHPCLRCPRPLTCSCLPGVSRCATCLLRVPFDVLLPAMTWNPCLRPSEAQLTQPFCQHPAAAARRPWPGRGARRARRGGRQRGWREPSPPSHRKNRRAASASAAPPPTCAASAASAHRSSWLWRRPQCPAAGRQCLQPKARRPDSPLQSEWALAPHPAAAGPGLGPSLP